jgi:glycosyltransferase involved in cell wall biosynthesis
LFPHLLYKKYLQPTEDLGKFSFFLKTHKPDVVLAEYGMCGAEIVDACKKHAVPLVVHFHGHDAYRDWILEKYKQRYQTMFGYAHTIISVSGDMTRALLGLGCPGNKIAYNPYGPREAFFALQPNLEGGYFLAVGRFVEKKAPLFTLLAFARVQQARPHARLTMVGTGELLGLCKALALAEGLNVTFTGALAHTETMQQFADALCFVQHSLTASDGDKEGTPVSILEAGASGLPVVSTRHAGIADVVLHGETGFLVNEGDIQGMADYMLKIYDDEALRRSIGAKAKQHIRTQYALNRHIDQLNKILHEAAK